MKVWLEGLFSMCFSVLFLLLAVCYFLAVDCSMTFAEGKSVLKGRVSDVEGGAVEGARVFVYGSAEVRRQADFITAGTGKDGLFRIALSPGRYWLVARLKKAEGYGPLMPGDKHSGEPREIELAPDKEVEIDFMVADLKEAIKIKTKTREGPVKISGRIIDENGVPIRISYAIANRNEKVSGIPDYLSAWVDIEGRYIMYIPRGRYYIGGAVTFPPGQDYIINGEMTIDADKSNVDIVIKFNNRK